MRALKPLPLLCALLLACEPAADVEPMACEKPEPASVNIGTGDKVTGFKALPEGSDIRVSLGPQGLHMIVVAVVLDDFETPKLGAQQSAPHVVVRHEGQVVAGSIDNVKATTQGEGEVVFLGIRTQFDFDEVDTLFGSLAEVAVTVRDGCGRDIRATRTFRLVK